MHFNGKQNLPKITFLISLDHLDFRIDFLMTALEYGELKEVKNRIVNFFLCDL